MSSKKKSKVKKSISDTFTHHAEKLAPFYRCCGIGRYGILEKWNSAEVKRFVIRTENTITIVGGGLAGSEAAWQAAQRGATVELLEMKPARYSPAHRSPSMGELVCSNSLRAESLENAVGLLKEEMRRLGSLVIRAADATRVPAGGALAVDRDAFSREITRTLEADPAVTIRCELVEEIPQVEPVIIATGPLTEGPLAQRLAELCGESELYFYDAIAPILAADSIDFSAAYRASRYDKGGADYVNCPLNREEYEAFVDALLEARKVPIRDFEEERLFTGCMPVEALAARGRDTLRYGPMKPVGLPDPRTDREPYAVVQLRQDNLRATLYNMVGFQTKLTYGEQERVFRMIPGLEGARFHRLGSLHRNTYLNAPRTLLPTLQSRVREGLFFAGQLTGVEGYVESTAMGLLAGINAIRQIERKTLLVPPETTALGALTHYITAAEVHGFQPMNINFGLFPPLAKKVKKPLRRRLMAQRALEELEIWKRHRLGA